MKKLVMVSLFIFWTIIAAVLVAGLVLRDKQNIPLNTGASSGGDAGKTQGVAGVSGSVILTTSEVLKHNTASNCWMIVSGKVYDLTNFLGVHSGGAGAMIPYCGKDGSSAYDTKDRTPARAHQQGDISILQSFYIGDLNQNVRGAVATSTPAHPAVPPTFRGGDDD